MIEQLISDLKNLLRLSRRNFLMKYGSNTKHNGLFYVKIKCFVYKKYISFSKQIFFF